MSLRAVSSESGAPQTDGVIEMLERALDEARRGDIVSLILILEHSDRTTSSRWATAAMMLPTQLLGAIEVCKRDWLVRYFGDGR